MTTSQKSVELTILMPCLNEAETLATCITKAMTFLTTDGINGEVLIADNGSTDGSIEIARSLGARVVNVEQRGYGNALRAGIQDARGTYVIMGDSDDSYNFLALTPFVDALRSGSDLVMGNRFKGGIEVGAMPKLHRYLGNPVLSFIGRRFFGSTVEDFHCGLRGFRRSSIRDLNLKASGMEFATEMVVRAELERLRVTEVPTTLSVDGRERPPHLRTWRDGWRHLRFLLLYSPRWLFIYPGAVAMIIAAIGMFLTEFTSTPGHFGIDTLAVCCGLFVVGLQSAIFGVLTKFYGMNQGYLPRTKALSRMGDPLVMEIGVIAGAMIILIGVAGLVVSFVAWERSGFGALNTINELRKVLPGVTLVMSGFLVVTASFFTGIMQIQ